MSRKKESSVSTSRGPVEWLGGRRALYAAALALVLFYWNPVVDRKASIQWDAVDVHYPSQRYFAEELLQGRLPQWTPFVFSGFPFLADPQVGAFYPLNWPFFLAGVTPWTIQLELVLHGALAVAGAFLLFRKWTGHAAAALLGALAYGMGGFFAGHSSHVGMFQGAALFPWMLFFAERGLESQTVRWACSAALTAGGIILAGHLQTAVFAVLALGLFLAARVILAPGAWLRAAAVLAAAAALGGCLAAVVVLPGMELTAESIRGSFDFSKSVEGALPPAALATLLNPNALDTLTGPYRGKADVTQTFFYAGILLLPLAALGAAKKQGWLAGGALVLLPVWYMLGPGFGLYSLGGLAPYLHQMRAPVNGWFVAGFGLAALAALGVVEAERRWRKPWLGIVLLGVFTLDLCLINSWINPLTYGRFNYKEFFGDREALLKEVRSGLRPGTRVDVPQMLPLFGPLNAALVGRIPSTGGYNPLELAAYNEYRNAARGNAKLINGLSTLVIVDSEKGEMLHNENAIPMVSFAKSVKAVASRDESRKLLPGLDPKETAVVEGLQGDRAQPAGARLTGLTVSFNQAAASYDAPGPVFATIAIPMYPGWRLQVDGRPVKLYRTNHALMGAELLEYTPERFGTGASVSAAALALLALGAFSPGALKRW
jgi:hypothetical protein